MVLKNWVVEIYGNHQKIWRTRAEFIQFLGYSKGSCGEFRSQLYRASDRKYLTQEQFDELYSLAVRISAMLQKLIEYLQKTEVKGVRKK